MTCARLNGIERDLEHDLRFHFAIAATIDNRVLFEMLGQFHDLDVGQATVGFSDRQKFAACFVAHRKRVIAQDVVAFAMTEPSGDHHHVQRGQLLL